MKEESNAEPRSEAAPTVSGLGPISDQQQLIQVINRAKYSFNKYDSRSRMTALKEECVDLDAAIDSDVINIDGTVTKLLGKDALRYKVSAKVWYLKYLSNY